MPALSWTITLDGRPLLPALADNVVSMEIVDSIDALGAISLEFMVPPTTERTSILAMAKPGALLKVSYGFTGGLPQVAEGDVIEVQHREGADRAWTIVLRALDRLHRLRQRPRTKMWTGAHSTIATTIATEHGFTPMVEMTSASTDFLLQANVPDAIFLKQLASRYNYVVRLDGKNLRFGRRDVGAGMPLLVSWARDVVDFKLTQSLQGIVTDVTAIARNYATNKPVIATVGTTAARNISGGTTGVSIAQTAFGTVWHRMDNLPIQNLSEAYALATAELQSRAERYVNGRLVVRGNPLAVAGQPLSIQDAPGYSGTYLIREVKHALRAGDAYRTTIEFFSDGMPLAVGVA